MGYQICKLNRRAHTVAFSLLATIGLLLPASVKADPFSLLCMPDPQYYTTSNHPVLYNLYNRQAQWIVDNKDAINIQHVIWLGDLTNDNTIQQWAVANTAYEKLDNADVPYAVVPGNHDYKTATGWPGAQLRNTALYNFTVGPQRFSTNDWYGGNMGETTNRNDNNYTYFSAEGLDFLVIGLEYAPRKEALTWANNLISQHPNHRVIIFTHAYMTVNGAYSGQAGSSFGIVGASGEEIFEELANRHSNVFMVVCGHVTESVVNTKTGLAGNALYEMLVDYQGERVLGTGNNLGNGWLRILQFNPDTNKINASTLTAAHGDPAIFENGQTRFYSTRYGASPAHIDHLFSLNYPMSTPMEPYTYLNGSVTFHAMGVSSDLLRDQLDPDIAQADNGDWVSVWEEDDDTNGVYEIKIRGFDFDGNERFSKFVANTSGVNTINATNPSIAMAPDGKFVVVWQRGSTEIKMRWFNADGTPITIGEETVVSVTSPGSVSNPDVAVDDTGNSVIAWADDADGNNLFQVKARGYNSSSLPRFSPKTVNTIAAGQQINPQVAMAANGDYVILWEDDHDGTWDLSMRGFLADESEMFAQTFANATTAGEQVSPALGMDDSGRFVVVWEDDADLNGAYQVRARGFNASGTELFSERTVNQVAAGNQINPAVDMDSNGNWYPVWEDSGVSGQGFQIMTNAFNAAGGRIHTSDIRANPVTAVSQNSGPAVRKHPVISAHKSGRYIVAWADDMDGDGTHQTLARGIAGTARSLVVKSINGTVTRSPEEPFYAPATTVQLTAMPDPGYSFLRWSGDVPAIVQYANQVNITMDSSKNITAEFEPTTRVGDWQIY